MTRKRTRTANRKKQFKISANTPDGTFRTGKFGRVLGKSESLESTLDRWASNMKTLQSHDVFVGYFAADQENQRGDGPTNLDLAIRHEFGLGVPMRSFMRATMDDIGTKKQLADLEQKSINGVLDGDDPVMHLNRIGLFAVSKIQRAITELKEPPNAQSTIDAKGSSNPLIDTGQMRASVTYALKRSTGF